MMLPRKAQAVVALTLIGLTGLTACGSNDDQASSNSSDIQYVEENPMPEGYQEVATPVNKIAIPVPEGWLTYNSSIDLESDQGKETLQKFADAMGTQNPDDAKNMLTRFDGVYMAPEDSDNGIRESINVLPETIKGKKELPDEEAMKKRYESQQLKMEGYEKISTPNGDVVLAWGPVGMSASRQAVDSAELIIPSVNEGEYTAISVNGSTLDRTKELAHVIADHWKPAK